MQNMLFCFCLEKNMYTSIYKKLEFEQIWSQNLPAEIWNYDI